VLVVIALAIVASMLDGCRNRPRPFEDWMKRRQKIFDERWRTPQPIDDSEKQDERRWMFRDRKRLLPFTEAYPCET
jgi:hypothetical protein